MYPNVFHFVQHDICKPLPPIQEEDGAPIQIDFIWHLACPASPPKYQEDGYKTLMTSVIGTMNILDLCRQQGPHCKLLFTSTSEIYGDAQVHPQPETYWGNVNPVGPRSCYDEGKRCAETLIYEFRKKHSDLKDNLKIVRIFNTFGPYMDIDDGRVITNYIKSILQGEPITIYGDGTQTRSFCYVDDLIDGFIAMMMKQGEVGPINLGNPDTEFSMIELHAAFERIVGTRLPVVYLPLPEDDPKQRRPDIRMAVSRLEWTPRVKLEHGLSRTLQYFKGMAA